MAEIGKRGMARTGVRARAGGAIPFVRGVKKIIAWYDGDESRKVVDIEMDVRMDQIITAYES